MGRICPTCQSTNKHQKQEHAVHNFSQPPFFELRSTLEIHWLKNKNRSVLPLPRTDHLCGLQAQPPSLLSYSLNYLKGTFSLNPLRTPQINIPHQQSSPPLLYSPPSPSEEPHHSLQHTAGGGGHTPSLPSPPHPGGTAVKDEGGTHTHTHGHRIWGSLPGGAGQNLPFSQASNKRCSPELTARRSPGCRQRCQTLPALARPLPAAAGPACCCPFPARSLPVPCLPLPAGVSAHPGALPPAPSPSPAAIQHPPAQPCRLASGRVNPPRRG